MRAHIRGSLKITTLPPRTEQLHRARTSGAAWKQRALLQTEPHHLPIQTVVVSPVMVRRKCSRSGERQQP
jgi:hypothetical protein